MVRLDTQIIRISSEYCKSCKQCVFQMLAHLLYEAASECGCVDPKKVEKILGVSREEAEIPDKPVQG